MTEAVETATCSQCGKVKPHTAFFHRKTGRMYSHTCRRCIKKRGPVRITIGGEEKTLVEWAAIAGIRPQTIAGRWRKGIRGEALIARQTIVGDADLPAWMITARTMEEWEETPYETDLHAQRCVEFACENGLTLLQVGVVMGGVSRERVRQIEEEALRKLRRMAKRASHLAQMDDVTRWDWFVRMIKMREITQREAVVLIEAVAHELVHGTPMIDLDALAQHSYGAGGWVYPEGAA